MRLYYLDGTRKVRVNTGKRIGRGGEATVYALSGRAGKVAKIYHRQDPQRAAKLRSMIRQPPRDPARSQGHASLAWPERLLMDEKGAEVGYTMPAASGTHAFADIYHPAVRKQKLSGFFTYRHLLRTAQNLCHAVAAIHDMGYVIGDINESNVLVRADTLVTVIDCDSFQVNGYLCTVGRPEYLPPELHGRSLSVERRKPEQDCFALAVLVYQLLMAGKHPYAGRGEPGDLQARVQAGLCPHAPGGPEAPVGAYELSWLPAELQRLVESSFVAGHAEPSKRPAARDWVHVLSQAEQEVQTCRRSSDHPYFSGSRSCPACQIATGRSRPHQAATTRQQALRSTRRIPRLPVPVLLALALALAPVVGHYLRPWLEGGGLAATMENFADLSSSTVNRERPAPPISQEVSRVERPEPDDAPQTGSEIYREYLGQDPY